MGRKSNSFLLGWGGGGEWGKGSSILKLWHASKTRST